MAQVFSNKLSRRQDVAGIKFRGSISFSVYLRMIQITDILLQATSQCVEAVVQELNEFGVYSGCKSNVS